MYVELLKRIRTGVIRSSENINVRPYLCKEYSTVKVNIIFKSCIWSLTSFYTGRTGSWFTHARHSFTFFLFANDNFTFFFIICAKVFVVLPLKLRWLYTKKKNCCDIYYLTLSCNNILLMLETLAPHITCNGVNCMLIGLEYTKHLG